ncbi:protein Smaug homolog 1 [Bacillus rossius redtenbacheri]|uniref:protein Smaug homolog 1 n=1 Tax=Bacillus rossius redtenbacheri TaxID=93214 RepID=UPI002FDCD33C
MFRDEVDQVTAMFEGWNECEQTVALYALLKRLSPVKARFLSLALDQSLSGCINLHQLEQEANNPGYVSSLLAEGKEEAMRQLLVHLPLLKPGNHEARTRYLAVIHKVLSHSAETGAHVKEARQLLCYSLIHPAITLEDRSSLTHWMHSLEERITSGAGRVVGHANGDSPHHSHYWSNQAYHSASADCHFYPHNCNSAPSITSHRNLVNYSNGSHQRTRRSNSLTPPVSITQVSSELWSSQDDLSGRQKPRSFSLSSEPGPPLSPQSSLASSGSGSESHLDDLRLGLPSESSGTRDEWLKDVGTWLKSLRLHKYNWLFAKLSYEDMLGLTEEKLSRHNITEGACRKIALSVSKLRNRSKTLATLEKDVMGGGDLRGALEELRAILLSPLKARSEEAPQEREETEKERRGSSEDLLSDEDIPAQFCRVMGRVCTQLLVSSRADEESARLFAGLLERAAQHEAFGAPQKRRLLTWRAQVQDAWQCFLPAAHKGAEHRQPRHKWHHHSGQFALTTNHNGFSHGHLAGRGQRFVSSPQPIQGQQRGKGGFGLYCGPPQVHRNSLTMLGATAGAGAAFLAKRPSLQDPLPEPGPPYSILQRAVSAPLKPNPPGSGLGFGADLGQGSADPELNSRLESLCLSMTEHALGGPGEL